MKPCKIVVPSRALDLFTLLNANYTVAKGMWYCTTMAWLGHDHVLLSHILSHRNFSIWVCMGIIQRFLAARKNKKKSSQIVFYAKWAPSKLINHNYTIKQVKDYLIHVICHAFKCFQMPVWSLESSLHVMLLLDVHYFSRVVWPNIT